MPPNAIKTVKDTIYWQYAKLISKSAGMGINARAFQMSCFQKLKKDEMKWSSTIREWIREHEKPNECIYCGSGENLTTEHILPRVCRGPDIPDNAIKACKNCNSKKGGKRLYEWFGYDKKDKIPRIAEGKYLKLLCTLHEKNGTLDITENELKKLCAKCNMKESCIKVGKEGELNIFCLEGCFCR